MKRVLAILCAVTLTISLSAQTEARTFYASLGNAYSPTINFANPLFFPNGMSLVGNPTSLGSNVMSLGGNVMSFGNEWITGITIDGDDDDNNGNYYWDKDAKDKRSHFSLQGQFGYFITNALLTGIGIEYGSFSNLEYSEYDADGDGYDDEITYKNKMNSLAFSPFAKYYVSLGKNALFISSSYTFGTINSSNEWERDYTSWTDIEDDNKAEPFKTSRLEFGAGMAFFLTESISLEPSVNYALSTYTQEEEIYLGNDPITGNNLFDDQVRKVSTNAFYFKIAASIFF